MTCLVLPQLLEGEMSRRSSPPAANAPPGLEIVGHQHVVDVLDAALKKHGDLGAYGDLSGGVAELARSCVVRVTVGAGGYFVEVAPRGEAGHDVSLRVDPRTLELHDVVVGAVANAEP